MKKNPDWVAWLLGAVCLVVLVAASVGLTGCFPVSLRPEVSHVSHVSQHFQDIYPADLGYTAALLDLHLEPVSHLQIDIAEGALVGGREQHNSVGTPYVQGLMGPREVFSATVAWDIPLWR